MRRDTAAQWTAVNPILASGEWGVETDNTGALSRKAKMGDGVTPWNALPYFGGGEGGGEWFTGAGAPSNSLGADGDLYLDSVLGDVYQNASGTWSVVANIKGQGVPAGGTAGQVLVKTSAANFATAWVNQSGGGNVLPVVTGEIVGGQPIFVILDDGSLVYSETT